MVEITDLIFAVDSIPAIVAIAADPFLVFTSNVFAILGLRSLHDAIGGMVDTLRLLEPCATYAARMATSLAFVEEVLARVAPAVLDAPALAPGGVRSAPLRVELSALRRLFEGVHLVVCEDLGLAPRLGSGMIEPGDHDAAREAAADWLADFATDLDLAVDARVAFPIGRTVDGRVRTWCTSGVRAVRLAVRFDHTPHVRTRAAAGSAPEPWQPVARSNVQSATWILLVEQAEELTFDAPPTREELRRFLERR